MFFDTTAAISSAPASRPWSQRWLPGATKRPPLSPSKPSSAQTAFAKAMRAALQAAGNDPEWMAAKGEAHGFYDEDNNVELYGKLLAFFGRHIGPGAPKQ